MPAPGPSDHGESRVFIAADPPRETRDHLTAWAREADTGPGSRVVQPENIHLTLCFLGNRTTDEVELAAGFVRDSDPLAPTLTTGAPVWLPKRRPRVLAIEVHETDGLLSQLQKSLASRLQAALDWEAAPKFRPHITVVRFGRGAQPRTVDLPPTPPVEFVPPSLTLFRSELTPEGALYEPIESRSLVPGQ